MRAVIDVALSPLKRKSTVGAFSSRHESHGEPSTPTTTRTPPTPQEAPASPSADSRNRAQSTSWSPFGQRAGAPPSPQYQSESSSRSDGVPRRFFGRSAGGGGSASSGDNGSAAGSSGNQKQPPRNQRQPQHQHQHQHEPERYSPRASKNVLADSRAALMTDHPGRKLQGQQPERYRGNQKREGAVRVEASNSGARREPRRMSVGPGCVTHVPQSRRLSTGSGAISAPDNPRDHELVRPFGAPTHRQMRRMSTGTSPVDKDAGTNPIRRHQQPSDGRTVTMDREERSMTLRQQRRMSTGTTPKRPHELPSDVRQQRRMSAGGYLSPSKYYHMDATSGGGVSHALKAEASPVAEVAQGSVTRRMKTQERRGSTGHAATSTSVFPRRMSTGSAVQHTASASRSQASDDSYYRHEFYREPQPRDSAIGAKASPTHGDKSHRRTPETVNTPNHEQAKSRFPTPKTPFMEPIGGEREIVRDVTKDKSVDSHCYEEASHVPREQSSEAFNLKAEYSRAVVSPKDCESDEAQRRTYSPRLSSPRNSAGVSPRLSPKSQSNTSYNSIDSHEIIRGVPLLSPTSRVSDGASRDVSHHRMERRFSQDHSPNQKSERKGPKTPFSDGTSRFHPASAQSPRAERRGSNDFRPSPPVRTRTLQSTDSCLDMLDQTERFSVENGASEDEEIIVVEEDGFDYENESSQEGGSPADDIEEFHYVSGTPQPSAGPKPTKLYDHARRCQWDHVLDECSRNHRDASYVCPCDGTTALHLAVMSRCNPLLRNGDLKGYKPAPRLVVEALLVACPEAAITRCSAKKYTPLTYACLVTDDTFDMSDAADMVVTILRHAPQSAYVFTDDGFSALDIHIMSYSRLHGHKEEVYSGGRTSTVVLRTLLEEKPVLADARTYRNKIRGPLELLYRCNMEEFKEAVEGGAQQRSKPKHLNSVVSTLDDWWAWKWAQLLMKYASLSSEEVKTKQPFRAVQAAARLVGCPIPILSLAIAMFPQQLEIRDPRGELYNLPLHEVASWRCDAEIVSGDPFVIRRKARAIRLLLDEYPAAARTTNNMGETPLQLAIEAGTPWHGGLEVLVMACPKALKFPRKLRSRSDENKTLISVSLHSEIESVDSEDEAPEVALEGMYPFMVAAVVGRIPTNLQRDPSFLFEGQTTNEHVLNLRKKDLESVRSIYGLLRARPAALASYISDARGKQREGGGGGGQVQLRDVRRSSKVK